MRYCSRFFVCLSVTASSLQGIDRSCSLISYGSEIYLKEEFFCDQSYASLERSKSLCIPYNIYGVFDLSSHPLVGFIPWSGPSMIRWYFAECQVLVSERHVLLTEKMLFILFSISIQNKSKNYHTHLFQ
jgi:hypothetical protein